MFVVIVDCSKDGWGFLIDRSWSKQCVFEAQYVGAIWAMCGFQRNWLIMLFLLPGSTTFWGLEWICVGQVVGPVPAIWFGRVRPLVGCWWLCFHFRYPDHIGQQRRRQVEQRSQAEAAQLSEAEIAVKPLKPEEEVLGIGEALWKWLDPLDLINLVKHVSVTSISSLAVWMLWSQTRWDTEIF